MLQEKYKKLFEEADVEKKTLRINGYIRLPKKDYLNNVERLSKSVENIFISIDYDYGVLLKDSYRILYSTPESKLMELAKKFEGTYEDGRKAIEELRESTRTSITKWEQGTDKDKIDPKLKKIAHGVTYDDEEKVLYIVGVVEKSLMLVAPRVTLLDTSPKVMIKNAIRKTLPSTLRTLKFDDNELYKIALV